MAVDRDRKRKRKKTVKNETWIWYGYAVFDWLVKCVASCCVFPCIGRCRCRLLSIGSSSISNRFGWKLWLWHFPLHRLQFSEAREINRQHIAMIHILNVLSLFLFMCVCVCLRFPLAWTTTPPLHRTHSIWSFLQASKQLQLQQQQKMWMCPCRTYFALAYFACNETGWHNSLLSLWSISLASLFILIELLYYYCCHFFVVCMAHITHIQVWVPFSTRLSISRDRYCCQMHFQELRLLWRWWWWWKICIYERKRLNTKKKYPIWITIFTWASTARETEWISARERVRTRDTRRKP